MVEARVWQQMFDRLVHFDKSAMSRQHDQQGSPVQRRREGGRSQAIGCSRGGRTTKTHAVVDAAGRLIGSI